MRRAFAVGIGRVMPIVALALAHQACAGAPAPARAKVTMAQAAGRSMSADTQRLADWVVASGDTHGLPFIIVDKVAARAFAFSAHGLARGSAPVLLGAARGDISPPGIGSLRLADITPAMRITPAGRFEARLGRDLGPRDILWVDYEAAISLHRVITTNPVEHRLARLTSATIDDNRISYGCINVPVHFYEGVVLPLFKPANGIVYILPETTPIDAMIAGLSASPKQARQARPPPR
ncbi:hypothetical protein GCM10009087_02880 [Sphingomonas oligophenolica]|uniref:L,D-transpeptidase n=1 Tax=Sphingomonas oligophenolica TaxID=301154 RepID=A0ABU9Y0L6_9SPHN